MASLIRRLWREMYTALQAYGSLYVSGPWHPADAAPARRPAAGQEPPGRVPVRLQGPPRAHPERLCPEIALSPVEQALNRQLKAGS
ncbi:DUF6059 family protein [Streptomyces sp. NPDC002564]|uniref:DUF6059 family protein n=1 Tax=Streptomyces sp. NPDC002564 TaxID=3364649 RepID=UPI0036AFD9D6